MTLLTLTKHHALGNDFLVLVDLDGAHPVDAALARALCDRHRGVGADGVVRAAAGTDGADVTMQLRNADGGEAEMSGNGIRCLSQAVVGAGVVAGPDVVVATVVGPRRVSVHPDSAAGGATATVSVDMGAAKVGPDQREHWLGWRARTVDVGNPHLVVLTPDLDDVDVAVLGPRVEGDHAGGINVEFVSPEEGQLGMRVWERGVGETLACGTGACAAAAAAHEWGLVGPDVVVHQPGGDAHVELTDTVVLSGPVHRIARVEVER
ncbi:MAG: diaminopimelate epimerase [Actinomycetota bacterium]|nr:diaminopimelate epimerase [Actinomycetota bacterium]